VAEVEYLPINNMEELEALFFDCPIFWANFYYDERG